MPEDPNQQGGGRGGLLQKGMSSAFGQLAGRIPGFGGGDTGLPRTGLQRQAMWRQQQQQAFPGGAGYQGGGDLSDMASRLAQQYGIPLGSGSLVGPGGNLTMTPDQIAVRSGGSISSGDAAAKLQLISDALFEQKKAGALQRGTAAVSAGLSQVQNRGRGSLASMQSGMYQHLGQMYASQDFVQGDYSYWVVKEQQERQERMLDKQLRAMKKAKKYGMIGSIAGLIGGALIPGVGAGAGAAIGGGLGQGGSLF